MNNTHIRRWSKISLRTLHLLAVAGVGGGVFFALGKDLWINFWWLALVSGILLVAIDAIANPLWLIQVRGLVIYVKVILLVLLGLWPEWDIFLIAAIIIISGIISHAPSRLRYYSVFHGRVIESKKDSKG